MEDNKQIILFDGVCNLCNGLVQWVIKRDRHDIFRFAPIQGKVGERLIREYNIDPSITDSIILIRPSNGYTLKSSAVLRIGRALGGIYKALIIFHILPSFLRDKIYDWVAKNRYKWYGKRDQCMIPTPELKAKFLEEISSDYSE